MTPARVGRPLAAAVVAPDLPVIVRHPADLGTLVRALRVARRLPQGEMAARLGVSRGLLAGLERGDRGVRLDLALRILADLGVTVVLTPPEARR